MNSFNLFRLDEGRGPRTPRYISEIEFQFIYDCLHGKYKSLISKEDKDKLERKIVQFLDVETIFNDNNNDNEYANCKAAQKHFERLKKENPGKEKLINVQLFCSEKIPKFMNVYIQKIFENIQEMENDSFRKKFISLHIDVFVDFFTSREDVDTVSLNPKSLLYQELVEMYYEKYDKNGNRLISFEFNDDSKNYIFNTFKDYLGEKQGEQKKSKSYLQQDCRLLDSTIKKLLCSLIHKRKMLESFKFERSFEHSNQFIPYKGNVNYQINTLIDLNGALKIEGLVDANEDNTVREIVYLAYANTIKIILATKEVKDAYKNCYEQNKNYTNCLILSDDIKDKIKLIFKKTTYLKFEEHNKMTKGDIMVDVPVSLCGEQQNDILFKGDILELKYFTIDDIMGEKKKNTLHITRILEPNISEILKIVKNTGLLNDYNSDEKFFKKFLIEILDIIIEVTEKRVEEDLERIKRTFDNVKGIIIAGLLYIENDNWEIFINKGKTGQQGRGVAISLKLPNGFQSKVKKLKYIESSNLFCFAN